MHPKQVAVLHVHCTHYNTTEEQNAVAASYAALHFCKRITDSCWSRYQQEIAAPENQACMLSAE
jgi:hypothetical protein